MWSDAVEKVIFWWKARQRRAQERPAAAVLRKKWKEHPTAVPAARRRISKSDAGQSTANSMMKATACVQLSTLESQVERPVSVQIRNVQAFAANKVKKSQKR